MKDEKSVVIKFKRILLFCFTLSLVLVIATVGYVMMIDFGGESPCVHEIYFEENEIGNIVKLNITGFDQHGDVTPEFHSTSNYKIFVWIDDDDIITLPLNESQFYHWDNSTFFSYEDVNNNQILDENDIFVLSAASGETINIDIFYIPFDVPLQKYTWSPD